MSWEYPGNPKNQWKEPELKQGAAGAKGKIITFSLECEQERKLKVGNHGCFYRKNL